MEMEGLEMRKKAEEDWVIFGDICSKYYNMIIKAKKIGMRSIISELSKGHALLTKRR